MRDLSDSVASTDTWMDVLVARLNADFLSVLPNFPLLPLFRCYARLCFYVSHLLSVGERRARSLLPGPLQ
jgi:hypothetical protein